MPEITKESQEKYLAMVEALNNFYWDNSILPEDTAARLDKFAGECVRLAQFIRGEISSLPRVAEQRDAPVHAEPKCPSCVGMGVVDDGGFIFKCFTCDGTGILNRSAGG